MNYNIGNEMINPKAASAYLQGADGHGAEKVAAQAVKAGRTDSFRSGYALDLGASEREGQIFGEQKKGVTAQLQDDLASNAKAQKDFMILASNTMSPEAYGKLAEDGYDVQQMDPEETVTVVV